MRITEKQSKSDAYNNSHTDKLLTWKWWFGVWDPVVYCIRQEYSFGE